MFVVNKGATSCSLPHPIYFTGHHKAFLKLGHGLPDALALRGFQNDRVQVACGAVQTEWCTRDHGVTKCYEVSPC